MSSPLLMPLKVIKQPGTNRVDYFALAPDTVLGTLHGPHWNGPGSGPLGPGSWKSLGGDGSAIDGYWTEDNSQLVLVLVGDDSKLWLNVYTASSNTWSGWNPPSPDSSLFGFVVATS